MHIVTFEVVSRPKYYSINSSIDHLNRMSLLFFLLIFLIIEVHTIDLYTPSIITGGPTYSSYKFNVLQHLTAIAPYFESTDNERSPDPPPGCTVDKAVYLVRHGSIYANDYDYENTIYPFLQRLQNSSKPVDFSRSTDLAFLGRWTSPITNSNEQLEKLTKSGSLEAFNLGTQLAYRYPNLMSGNKNVSWKIWASASNRTKQSASALIAGLYGEEGTIDSIVAISEAKDQEANTLTPTKTCAHFNISAGSEQAETWLKHYAVPIIARFNAENSGFQFSPNDVLAMQELCGYETVIRGSSPFCRVFTAEEWLSFEYYFDIKYYYSFGYGNNLSPSLGMPWVVATSDLLNATTATYQDLYISVVHREMLPFVLTALGVYNDSKDADGTHVNPTFPLDQINYQRAWKSSKFVPFLGHIALERLQCTSMVHTGKFVRILVNSAPQSLPRCTQGPGASCPLAQYMDYITRQDESFENFSNACKMNSQSTTNVLTFFNT